MLHKRLYILTLTALLLSVLSTMAATYSVDHLPNVQIEDHTKHLVNPDGIVSPQVQAQIDTLLLDARRQTSAEIVAVIVDDIDTDDIDTYATKLFEKWGIGKRDKDNGILLVVTKNGRAATIRTGYGAEGILPDITAGRIIDRMTPHFRDGDYDGGMLAGVQAIHDVVTDPDAAEELRSGHADNYGGEDIDLFGVYLKLSAIVAIVMLVVLGVMMFSLNNRKPALTDYQKYQSLHKYQLAFWVVGILFVGIPILAAVANWLVCRHLRNHPRKCPRCQHQMQKLSEAEDNKYLNYAQDLEERIKSVDYDVWLCPHCGETDIYSFINNASTYKECPNCHARTLKLSGTRILREPTVHREGQGEKLYTCLNCQYRHSQRYTIPKKEPPVVVVGGGRGRGIGGFGGGGSFGGGFGGGLTGGGGATGRW